MKHGFLIILVIGTVLIWSCGEDEEDGFDTLSSEFVGTWYSSALQRSGCDDSSEDGTCDATGCLSVVFSEDGTYIGSLVNDIIAGIATNNDETLRLCEDVDVCTDIAYSLTSDKVSVSWTDAEDGCEYAGTLIRLGFPNELVGTWASDDITTVSCDDSADDMVCTSDCVTYSFQSDGTFTGQFGDEAQRSGVGYVEGSVLTLCWVGYDTCQPVNYSISGDMATVSWDDVEDGCETSGTLVKQ